MGNEGGDRAPKGLTGRVDTALDRRGFTTRKLRLRATAVVLAISLVPVGAAWFAAYRLTNLGGPDSVCDGAATADQLHELLGSGRISEATRGYSATSNSTGNSCTATVSSGVFEKSGKTVRFTVVRDSDYGPGELAAPDARLFSGGSAGSVTPGAAWAVLPEGCEKGVRAEVRTGEAGHDETRARLAVAFANGLAKARGCGNGALPAPMNLSEKGAETNPDWANLCGLPGFAPVKNPDAQWRMPQQVTTATAPVWSCTVGGDPRHDSRVQEFAITTEPRTTALAQKDGKRTSDLGRAQWVAGGTLVTTCQGKDVFFTITGGITEGLEKPFLFPDQKDLVRQFLTAGGKAIGCEPIL
ncbi:hypothetical protein [Streptomyces sp. CBMA156]|uniref:hypothetical protein n=1 Tax=Streptomyces sp. CBMA156 TaxID=1930280 RepID=UPI001661D25C|nr:hypothetical protein [Streptomyces sp. CBMA156]MBD0672499.1 hypothetical protein [Streptomyces sp. CBMA156]